MSREQEQKVQTPTPAKAVFERMIQATNRHDLEGMLAYFAPDYRSEQPLHPELNFAGTAGVRRNWAFFFEAIPDIQAEILTAVEDGDTVWAELRHHGTQRDGTEYAMRSVMICGVQDNHIRWARLYIEPRRVSDSPVSAIGADQAVNNEAS